MLVQPYPDDELMQTIVRIPLSPNPSGY